MGIELGPPPLNDACTHVFPVKGCHRCERDTSPTTMRRDGGETLWPKFIFPKSERVTFGKGSAFYIWSSCTYAVAGVVSSITSVIGGGIVFWLASVMCGIFAGLYWTGMERYSVYPQDEKEASDGK